MAKSASKKESLKDLKEELVNEVDGAAEMLEEKADDVAFNLEEKAEDVAKEVLDTVDDVKKDRRFAKIMKSFPRGKFPMMMLALLAIAGLSGSGYFYYQYSQTQNVLGSSQEQEAEVKSIVEDVGKLIELPDEEPTIATVSDKEQLKSQSFFDKAQNGDKVLIYQQTRKAILYRPSINKIIDVGSINLEAQSTSAQGSSATPTPEPEKNGPIDVVILNGTKTSGLTVKGENEIDGLEDVNVVERDNALESDYEGSVVVNLTNVNEERVKEIARALQANIGDLPEGEKTPDADVLVILGSDFSKAQSSSE